MKLELLKPMGKMKSGDSLYARSKEQADMLIEQGYAKEVEPDPVVEKELVLVKTEPGTYTTQWLIKSEVKIPEPVGMTAKEVIEKINASTTVEEVNALVPETETRKTVTDAATKKITELSKD